MTFKFSCIFLFIFLVLKLVKCESVNHAGHLKPFGSSGPFLQLDQLEDMPTKNFFDNYVKPKKPVVMKNLARTNPAFSLWKDDYFRSKSKGQDYKIIIETQKKESRDQQTISLSLEEFLNLYRDNSIYMVNDVPPYLKQDVVLPQPLQCGQASKVLEETVMWFSSGGTSSVTHTDDYENIVCMFDGIKEFVLVDYYKHKRTADILIDEHRGSFSSMDVDSVNYEHFPGIENLEYYKLNISAGDCIYLPLKWVHQVRSYGRNVAVNFWFNYEKIFGNSVFGDECSNNKLDLTQTLDKLTYSPVNNDYYSNFKIFIMRQVNLGVTKLNDWMGLILGERELPQDEKEKTQELLKEIFSIMDFNGDGNLSDDEIVDLDENSLEHIGRSLEEIENFFTSEENQDDEKEDENHNEEL